MKLRDFIAKKQAKQKITIVTCYDFCFAKLIAATNVDCILVGDSVAMVLHGHQSTIPANVELMVLHTQAVKKAGGNKFIITDMPFLSYRKSINKALDTVEKLMQAGAHAIKLEGVTGNEALIKHIVSSGIPVMGHIGFTPQSIYQIDGYMAKKNDEQIMQQLYEQAHILEQCGCFAIVLECVDKGIAAKISNSLRIPTIGIGAGPQVDGQVLVLHDLLGFNQQFKPKFLKKYMDGAELVTQAVDTYVKEVQTGVFPDDKHSY